MCVLELAMLFVCDWYVLCGIGLYSLLYVSRNALVNAPGFFLLI